ncbi:TetR family transcriptional regulator [Corynebacterium amycolatum]|nr:TetR family transcriptional regulator [Corynebacterium amycolatum]MCQ9126294.1 TetR family transcriptional regulator [Corynebacterium amycolatum]MCQ9169941.1 TetR family transcriptional regulator [Corynebacterium amycolatum]MCQ9177159.1 TetR family transcriptional regulator [Corynebacterium amycolatum]
MTKDIIVDAALTILNEYGLGDLTIRRLTRHLGTAAGAMYWHYPSKQALLGAVADRILAPCTEFSATGDWRADTEAIAELLYSCLTAHRDGAEVVSAALATGTATIRPEQLLADVLENAPETSISTPSAADTASVLVYFILGATVDQQTAIALNLNGAKSVSDKGDTNSENNASTGAAAKASSEDAAEQAKELGRQRIALGTELFIAGIAGIAGIKGTAGQ